MLPISSFIALKYIKSKKHDFLPSLSFFTSFIGIFLSVFALILVTSVMEGFKLEFQKTVIGIRPHMKIYFHKNGNLLDIPDYKQKIAALEEQKQEILHVGGGVSGEVMASNPSNNKLSGGIVSGLKIADFVQRKILKNSIKSGNIDGFDEGDGIIIGSELADLLGLKVGNEINLISPIFRNTPFGNIPIHKTYKVKAIFNVGMYIYDSTAVFMPLKQAQVFFQKKNSVSFLEVILQNPNHLKGGGEEIRHILKDVYITDWQSENASFIKAINLQKSVMMFILFLFLLLASFICFSGLSNLVLSKNKTTAILRTIGLSKIQVTLIFLQVGLFTSLPAIILGMIAGSITAIKLDHIKNLLEHALNAKIFDGAHYFLSFIPSNIDFKLIFTIGCVSFLMCFISILFPSLKAINSKPIDALRWE